MRIDTFRPDLVESTPKPLEPGVLYISERFKTAIHLCACGCGEKVVTPLNPAAWSVRMTGGQATLQPSIGNWSMACKSHYFIRNNRVVWARPISPQAVKKVFAADRAAQNHFFSRKTTQTVATPAHDSPPSTKPIWRHLWDWLCGR